MGTVRLYSAQRKVKEHFLDGRSLRVACTWAQDSCVVALLIALIRSQWQDCLQPHIGNATR